MLIGGLLLSAAGTAGCGAVTVGPPIPGPPTATGAHHAATAAIGSGGRHSPLTGRSQVRGKSPAQIARATNRAFGRVHSYQYAIREVTTDGRTLGMNGAFVISNGADRGFAITLSDGALATSVRETGGSDYVTATAQYWLKSHFPANQAASLANRWIRLPEASEPGFAEFRDMTDPAKAARCALDIGSLHLTSAHRATVGGAPVIILSGGAIGTAQLDVSAKGAPLPLLMTASGPAADSGANKPDPTCGQTAQTTSGGSEGNPFGDPRAKSVTVTFGDYNAPGAIAPPTGPVLSIPGAPQT